ncbi:MAG: MFS transporter [Acidimicrobiia bacterium]
MTSPLPPPPPEVDYGRKWLVMITISVGVILATIDGSIVNVAFPTLVDELGTTFNAIQWVALGYLLTIATLTLGVGRLGDIVGKKRIYTAGFSVFTIASMLCGLAPGVGWLIGFRVVQGLGSVMILALGAAILTEAFPPTERGRALGLIGTAVSIGIITGPVVGGLLISTFGWRAIFFVNLPIGILGTLLALRHVPNTRPVGGQTFDFLGAGLLSASLFSVSLALTLGQDLGFRSPPILTGFAVAMVSAVAFVAVERRAASPMVRLDLFRDPRLSVGVTTGFLVFSALSATFLLLPFYLEGVLGFDVREVGLLLGAAPLVVGIAAPLSGNLSDRVGVKPLTVAGLAILTVTFFGFLTLDIDTGVLGYLVLAIPVGLGVGVFQSPNNSAIMGAVPREYSGVAGGLLTLTRLLGQIWGIAVLGSVWAARVAGHAGGAVAGGDPSSAPPAAQVAGIHDTFVVVAGIMLLALAIGVWGLRRESRPLALVPDPA